LTAQNPTFFGLNQPSTQNHDISLPIFSPTPLLLPTAFVNPLAPFSQVITNTVYIGASANGCPTNVGSACTYYTGDGGSVLPPQEAINAWAAAPDNRWDVVVTNNSDYDFGSTAWTWPDKYGATQWIVFHSDNPNPRGRLVCSHGMQDYGLTPPFPDAGQRNHGCKGYLGFPSRSYNVPVDNGAYTYNAYYDDYDNHLWTISSTVSASAGSQITMGAAHLDSPTSTSCPGSGLGTSGSACPNDGVNHILIQDAAIGPDASVTASIIPVLIKAQEWVNQSLSAAPTYWLAAAPHDIGFDEDYFFSSADDDGFSSNIITQVVRLACQNCWFNHNYMDTATRAGGEGHGLDLSDAPGPLQIVHNYIDGDSIGLWGGGGAPPAVAGLLTTNVERRRNYLTYNQRWLPAPGGVQDFEKVISVGSSSCSSNVLTLAITNTGTNVISPLGVYLYKVGASVSNAWYTAASITSSAVVINSTSSPGFTCSGSVTSGGQVWGFASSAPTINVANLNTLGKLGYQMNPVAKNRTENKEVQSEIIDAEVWENSGADGQAGYAGLINVRACGGVAWCTGGQVQTIQDFVATNLILRHSNQAIQAASRSGGSAIANWTPTSVTCSSTGDKATLAFSPNTTMDSPSGSPATGPDVYIVQGSGVGSTGLLTGWYTTVYSANYTSSVVLEGNVAGTAAICTPNGMATADGTVMYGPHGENGGGVSLPAHRVVFQNILAYDIGNGNNWDGTSARAMLSAGGQGNNWSVTLQVQQLSPSVIIQATVSAINQCPVSQLCPMVIQAAPGDFAYIQCPANNNWSAPSGPPQLLTGNNDDAPGLPILTVASNQLSFTYTPNNPSWFTANTTVGSNLSCPLANPTSSTESGYYNYQSFPWPFYWNHNTIVGLNGMAIFATSNYQRSTTMINSFQLIPGTNDVIPAGATNAKQAEGMYCPNQQTYSSIGLTGITNCMDATTLQFNNYAMMCDGNSSVCTLGNYPVFPGNGASPIFSNGCPSGGGSCTPFTNSMPSNVACSGSTVTCNSGLSCNSTNYTPDCIGFTGAMSNTTYPLNLPDWRNYALITGPYKLGGLLGCNGLDCGAQIPVIEAAQNRTLYPCQFACGSLTGGPFRDGPQYAFMTWTSTGATAYGIYKSVNGGAYSTVDQTTSAYYTAYGLTTELGNTYRFIIKGCSVAYTGSPLSCSGTETVVSPVTSTLY
jgi:hypothetical protein